MAYLEFLRREGPDAIDWFHLRCPCGFSTEWAEVGFVGVRFSGSGHDAWRIAWFNAQVRRLEYRDFSIPLDVSLRGNPERWRDETLVPHIREVYGSCFVTVPADATITEIPCPECKQHHLALEPGG